MSQEQMAALAVLLEQYEQYCRAQARLRVANEAGYVRETVEKSLKRG